MLVVLLAIFVAMWLPFIVALLYAEYRDEREDRVSGDDEPFNYDKNRIHYYSFEFKIAIRVFESNVNGSGGSKGVPLGCTPYGPNFSQFQPVFGKFGKVILTESCIPLNGSCPKKTVLISNYKK